MKKIYLVAVAFIASTLTMNAQQLWDNFEDVRYGEYTFINGPLIPYQANPDPSGANTSQIAAKYTRNAAELFDVIVLTSRDGLLENAISYASGTKTMTLDVWSPNVGTGVQITLENNALAQAPFPAGRYAEFRAETTVAGAWETLEFDLLGLVTGGGVTPDFLDQIVILFEPNSNNGDTYYFDNFVGPELVDDPCEDAPSDAGMFNDFECQQNVNYFFSSAGTGFRRITNPDPTGNESAFVAQYNRNGNAADGNDVIQGDFGSPLQLSASSVMTLDVWSPSAGTTVRLALQNGNGDEIIAVDAETTTSEAWETLTFDVSPVFEATDIELFVLLFNPGADTFETYYFDNFQGTGILSVEEVDAVSAFNVFPNPAVSEANVSYNLIESTNVRFTLTDITGRVVQNQNFDFRPVGTHQFTVNTSSLADGVYIYSLRTDKGAVSGRLVVNK